MSWSNPPHAAPRESSQSRPDKYYGQRDLSHFCDYVVADLFSVPPMPRPGIDTPPQSPNSQGNLRKEPPPLAEFIAYALYRTRLPVAVTHQALFLLHRLKLRYPSARGTASSPHRLFLSALMLSSKISMDDTYSNKSWTIVGGSFFPLREVNQMERELFAFLDFNVVVSTAELNRFIADSERAYALRAYQGGRLSSSSSSSSLSSLDDARKRKRRDTMFTQQAVQQAQSSRHKRAADAAIALLRPCSTQAARIRSTTYSKRRFSLQESASSSSSSSSSSPEISDYRDSASSSGSSTATTPDVSTPASPHPLHAKVEAPDVACDKLCSIFSAHIASSASPTLAAPGASAV